MRRRGPGLARATARLRRARCLPAAARGRPLPVTYARRAVRRRSRVRRRPRQYGELTLPAGDPRGVAVLVHGGFWKPEYGIEYARPLVPSLVERAGRPGRSSTAAAPGRADTLADVAPRSTRCAASTAADRRRDRPLRRRPPRHLGRGADGGLDPRGRAGRRARPARRRTTSGLGGGAVEAFLGHPPGPADAEVDPIRQVPLDVPVWCVHGRDDDIVPISQSRDYVAAATAAGGPRRAGRGRRRPLRRHRPRLGRLGSPARAPRRPGLTG